MRYRKKTVIASRVESKWLSALNRKEGTAPALAHEWADQGDVGLFVHSDTRGPQEPVPAPTEIDRIDLENNAGVSVTLLAIMAAFVAGIAAGKLL